MKDVRRFTLSSATLLFVTSLPAHAQSGTAASAPPTKASEPPPTSDGRVTDPTLFVAVVVALVIGFVIGRATSGRKSAAVT